MHFRSLLTVNLPAVTPDSEWEKDISKAIEELHSLQPQPGIIMDNVMLQIHIERLNSIKKHQNTQITELLHNGKYCQAIYKAKRRKSVFAE